MILLFSGKENDEEMKRRCSCVFSFEAIGLDSGIPFVPVPLQTFLILSRPRTLPSSRLFCALHTLLRRRCFLRLFFQAHPRPHD